MAEHNDFGKKAEELVIDFLVKKGYKILKKNFRYQKAEVDIISFFKGKIIITEVKARNTTFFIEPQDAVTKKKIKLIVMATDQFMKSENRTEEVRFDIAAVCPNELGVLEINYLQDAFDAFDAN